MWSLISVAMVTKYYGRTCRPYYTFQVSCQCNVSSCNCSKKLIFTQFNLWPLAIKPDRWPYTFSSGVCETQFSTLGYIPNKFEENWLSRLAGIFWSKICTSDLLSRDLCPRLPWEVHMSVELVIPIIRVKFHVSGCFILKLQPKRIFTQFELWPLTFYVWLWHLLPGWARHTVSTLGYLPTKFEENRSSSLAAVFKTGKGTFDLLFRDRWSWLPWQPYVVVH